MKDIFLHIASDQNVPNVVRLNIPADHRADGAAWVYVPSKDVIYIGPPGSYADGGSVDLAATVKSVADTQKGEKFVTGVLYDDGYVDYFTGVDEDNEERLMEALRDYHDVYYSANGAFTGETKTRSDKFDNYPTEDTGYDPEDDHGEAIYDSDTGELMGYLDEEGKFTDAEDAHRPTLDDIPDDSAWGWLKSRDWSGGGDYSTMKQTPGTDKPISEWDANDHLNWRDEADKKRNVPGYGWSAREDLNHFRWSFGDDSLVKGAPHQGLWLWPTQGGYPDHFSQTGSNGLGNCAQGRVYPHFNNKWEILTWPDRPRNVKDKALRLKIQQEAEQAVKQYLIERIGIKSEDIFFTKMHYGEAVSMYDSPAYPREGGKSTHTPGLDSVSLGDKSGLGYDTGGSYDAYGYDIDDLGDWYYDNASKQYKKRKVMDTNQLTFDDNGDASYVKPDDKDRKNILERVVDKIKTRDVKDTPQTPGKDFVDPLGIHWAWDQATQRWYPDESGQESKSNPTLTPEEKWEQALKQHEQTVNGLGGGIMPKKTVDPSGYETWKDKSGTIWVKTHNPEKGTTSWVRQSEMETPEGTSHYNLGGGEGITIHKTDGKVITVTDAEYEEAVKEYGEENWWYKFLGPRDTVEDITKNSSIHDYDPDEEMRQGFINSLNEGGQPTGQSWTKNNGSVIQEAFCWLGAGYGIDAGKGDTKDAELLVGTAHWNIVNKLIGKQTETINQFLENAEAGNYQVPLVWGWTIRHPMLKGVYVKFLTHLMGVKQDVEFIPQVLAAISKHYKMPIEGYEQEDSETPIMERFPVSGGTPDDGSPTPKSQPTSLPLESPTKTSPVEIPPGAKILKQDQIGFVTITTFAITNGRFEAEISGGELDGHLYPSFSQQEAERTHDVLVRDEEGFQRNSSKIMSKELVKG